VGGVGGGGGVAEAEGAAGRVYRKVTSKSGTEERLFTEDA